MMYKRINVEADTRKKMKESERKKNKHFERLWKLLYRADSLRALRGKRTFFLWPHFAKKEGNLEKGKEIEGTRKRLSRLYGISYESYGGMARKEKENDGKVATAQSVDMDGDDERLKTISEITKESKYKREYLGYLIRQKKLKAKKVNGNWKIALEWVKEFEREAEQRKDKMKKEMSERMGREKEERVEKAEAEAHWAERVRINFQNVYVRAATALILLVFFVAAANITKADYEIWGRKIAAKVMENYNSGVEIAARESGKISGKISAVIERAKIKRESFNQIANSLAEKIRVKKFEEESGLRVSGPQKEAAGIADQERGLVAGETNQEGEPARNAMRSEAGKGIVLAETDTTVYADNIGDVEVSAYVLGSDNQEITNGDYQVRFSLYSVDRTEQDPYPSDTDQGSRVWEETQTVTIQNGLLSTYLGRATKIPESIDFGGKIYYLGVRIGEDSELVPRKRIGAVPLARVALNALTAQTLSGYTVGNASGNIPISNGTLNTNLNAQLLNGLQSTAFQVAGSYQPAGTYDNYVSWKLQSSLTDAGQQIKTKKGAIFTGANGITTSRNLNTLTFSLDPTYSPTFAGMTLNGDLNLNSSTNLIFGGTTSLGEATSPTDSGAFLVGANDEFANSASTNVQAVLKDLDTAIAAGGPGAMWTLSGGNIYPTNLSNNVGIGTTGPTQKLDISGGLAFSGYLSAPGALTAAAGAAGTAKDCSVGYPCTYFVTFVNAQGETQGGTASNQITTDNVIINLSNIPTGPAGVTARKIYRTFYGTAFLVATINDNITTSYADDVSSASLDWFATLPFSNSTAGSIYADDTKALSINQNGYVGIGTANPAAKLEVATTLTAPSNFTNNYNFVNLNHTSANADYYDITGSSNFVSIDPATTEDLPGTSLTGTQSYAYKAGTGDIRFVQAYSGGASVNGGNAEWIYGITLQSSIVDQYANSTSPELIEAFLSPYASAGYGRSVNVTSIIGVYSAPFAWSSGAGSTATVGNLYGEFIKVEAGQDSGGATSVSNLYGLGIYNGGASGTIANKYGLYIDEQTGATTGNFTLFSAGGTNYFGGSVGIGTTSPDSRLHLVGGDAYIAPDSGYTFNNPSANEDLYVYGNLEVDGSTYLQALTMTGTLTITGNIIPSMDDFYTLGDDTHRWKDIFLGGETIHIGASTGDEYTIDYNSSSNKLGFNVNGSGNPEIIFDANGNVGIGTTAPGARLEIGTVNTNNAIAEKLTVSADTDGDIVYGVYRNVNTGAGVVAAGDRIAYGAYNNLTVGADSGGANIGNIIGTHNEMNITGDAGVIYGAENVMSPGDTLTANSMVIGFFNSFWPGTIGNGAYAVGVVNGFSLSGLTSGSAEAIGVNNDLIGNAAGGTAITLYGITSSIGTGPGDTGYHLYVGDPVLGAGGTQYGFYSAFSDASVTYYPIYESTNKGNNILYANTRIGSTSNPANTLSVTGTADISGNVSIGTTASLAALTINGSIFPDSNDDHDLGDNTHRWQDIYLGPASLHIGSSTADEYTLSYDTTNNRLGFNVNGTGNPEFVMDANGYFGIGTTAPTNMLDIAGGVKIGAGYAGIGTTAPLNGLLVQGNVGIGTTSPSQTLAVNGSFSATGSALFGPNTTHQEDQLQAHDYVTMTSPLGVFVLGSYAYIADYTDGLIIYNISDPDNITLAGSTTENLNIPADGPQSVFVSGNYAYVIGFNGRLAIFDVSNPAIIVARGFLDTGLSTTGDYYRSISVQGNYVYLSAFGSDTFAIFDVSDKDNIIAKDTDSGDVENPASIQVSGSYAYVADYSNGKLTILNISDPNNITLAGSTTENISGPWGLAVSGSYAYVANYGNSSLAIFDVSNPASIVAKDFDSTNLSYPYDVSVSGGYAYLANAGSGSLDFFDVSDPDSIVYKGDTAVNLSVPFQAFASGGYAYVLDGGNQNFAIFENASVAVTDGNVVAIDNGNVGIGTTASSVKLDVNGSARIYDRTTLTGVSTLTIRAGAGQAANPYLRLAYDGSNYNDFFTTSAGNLNISRNGAAAMFALTDVGVGIGTTNPDAPLTVKGTNTAISYGDEKVTNGNFATSDIWTWGAGWTWNGASFKADHAAGNTADLEQDVLAAGDEYYKVVFTISGRTAGSVTAKVGGASGPAEDSNGVKTELLVATGSDNLKFTPSSDFDGKIDDVSVVKINPGASILTLRDSGNNIVAETRAGGGSNDSTFFGKDAGMYSTGGDVNTAFGAYALQYASLGSDFGRRNVAVGSYALRYNTIGIDNVAVGDAALYTNSSGSQNVAIGARALQMNTASGNTAVGRYALQLNTTGTSNVALGSGALAANTTGSTNIAIGSALTGNTSGYENVVMGPGSMSQNQTGYMNVAIGGKNTLLMGTNIIGNVALGEEAGRLAASNYNIFIGHFAGYTANSGSNVFIGYASGSSNTGSASVFLGYQSGSSNTGSGNVFLGFQAGSNETGSNKLYIENSSAGSNNALIYGDFNTNVLAFNGNVGIGTTAPGNKLSVSGGVGIGTTAPGSLFLSTAAPDGGMIVEGNVGIGTTAPGYKLDIDAGSSTGLHVKSTSATALETLYCESSGANGCGGNQAWYNSSDLRLKTDVVTIDNALGKVLQLRGVNFRWRSSLEPDMGFVAQEVKDVVPEIVGRDANGYYGMRTSQLTALLVEAVKQQQTEISDQGTRINSLDLKISDSKSDVSSLQTAVNDKLNIVSNSLTSLDQRVTSYKLQVTSLESQLSAAQAKLQTDENNLATFETATNDTLASMLETENMLTQRVLNHEDRLKALEDKIATLSVQGGQVPDNVVTQDEKGNVALAGIFKAKKVEAEGVVAGSFAVKNEKDKPPTMGEGWFVTGDSFADVPAAAVNETAKIFVSFESDPGARWWVEKLKDPAGENYIGFRVHLSEPAREKVNFSWWMVENKN